MESLRAENEAITKYHFNKEQIALSLSLSPALPRSFFPFSKSEKNDTSLSVHSKLLFPTLGFYIKPYRGWGSLFGTVSTASR